MTTINVTYYADNLDDVADELQKHAREKRASVRHAPTKKVRAIGEAEARGLDLAASIVRKVELGPVPPPLLPGDSDRIELAPPDLSRETDYVGSHALNEKDDTVVVHTIKAGDIDDVIAKRLNTKGDAFDFARATNLYLLAAREYGTCLGGKSCTELLLSRTDWDFDKCKHYGDRVIGDQAIVDLMKFEGVPESYDNG